VVSPQLEPTISPATPQLQEENDIMTDNNAIIEELPQITEVVEPKIPVEEPKAEEEISLKRKPEDSDMMDVDTSLKRARTESRSPSVIAETTTDAISPVAEAVLAEEAPAETPEKKPETPVAMFEETQGNTLANPNITVM
jgi:hypothetical protein